MSAVAERTAAVDKMVTDAKRCRALMGGTQVMRTAGEQYLPKFEAETDASYKERLALSWLFNGYRKTVKDMTGRVFGKSVELGEDTPDKLNEWVKNIDLAGRDLSTFAKEVFEDGTDAGISYIMVDAPAREGEVTRDQAVTEGLRPFLVHLSVESILGWRSEVINNVTVLSQLRIAETVSEPDPNDEFMDLEIEQVRVLDRDSAGVVTRIYRKVENSEEWVLHDQSVSDMQEITVIPFYANRTGFFCGEPPLSDLADVNIAHWQSQSDQRNVLHFARVPILFASGRADDEPVTISASSMTTASDPQAKMQWVEHSGKAIEAGRQDLKDMEFQMEAHGLQLLVARPGSESATGAALNAEKETSQLSMMADALGDALEQAMIWMLEYGGIADQTPTVNVNKEFSVGMMTAQEMSVLLNTVQSGNLSRQTFLHELARRGMVSPDLNPEDEEDRIADAQPAILGEPLDLGAEGELELDEAKFRAELEAKALEADKQRAHEIKLKQLESGDTSPKAKAVQKEADDQVSKQADAFAQAMKAVQEMLEQSASSKRVDFDRDAEDRITGATVKPARIN